MKRPARLTKESKAIARQALDSSESALQSVGEYLGLRVHEERSSSVEDALSFVSGLLFGALVAAAVAILLAPTDGPSLRRRLRDQWHHLLGGVSDVPERTYYSPEAAAPQSISAAANDDDDVMALRGAQRATLNASPG